MATRKYHLNRLNSALRVEESLFERVVSLHDESRDFLEVMKAITLLIVWVITEAGTWSVHTMLKISKTIRMAAEMRIYSLTLLEISEIRRTKQTSFSRHAEVLRPWKFLARTRSCIGALRRIMKSTSRIGISWLQDHHGIM